MIRDINKLSLEQGVSDVDFSFNDTEEGASANFPAGKPFYIVGRVRTSNYMGGESYIIMDDENSTTTVATCLVRLYYGSVDSVSDEAE